MDKVKNMAKVSQKRRIGRPTKYTPDMAEKCRAYFNGGYKEDGDVWPTKAGFALKMRLSDETLNEWTKKYPEFSAAYKDAAKAQEQLLVRGGLDNKFNASFAIFTAKNVLGWRDRQDEKDQNSTTINVGVVVLPSEAPRDALPQAQVIDVQAKQISTTHDREDKG